VAEPVVPEHDRPRSPKCLDLRVMLTGHAAPRAQPILVVVGWSSSAPTVCWEDAEE
jgi:hypothetical protein